MYCIHYEDNPLVKVIRFRSGRSSYKKVLYNENTENTKVI